ncbi:MAG: pyridoxal-dependent decarboxylase [Actinomycetota bacterium]|nr:pyridoxal-dependent decarboxylase [Actinomycetota bacterium]
MTDPELDDLLSLTSRLAGEHLATLDRRSVVPSPAALEQLGELDRPLGVSGRAAIDVVSELAATGGPATVAMNGGRYFGFVNGSTLPAALAADWLVSTWDQNSALAVMSPVASLCEDVAIRWIVNLLGLPEGTDGAFVTGATMANATCLAAARDSVLARAGWDSVGQGLIGAPEVQVIVGAEAHSTVYKALGIIGLGRDRVRRLPVDPEGAIDPGCLAESGDIDGPAIVCLQAGNVNSGASDPFGPLIGWARGQGAWVHVDGAFGLWAAAAPERRHLVDDVQAADSWATDGHKWLNVPYDSGLALVRDPASLRHTMGSTAAYLPDSGRDSMHLSPQSSQRARGVVMWAALQSLGADGVADLVERCCRLAARFARALDVAGIDVLNEVALNQVVVAFGDDDTTDAVIAGVQEDGRMWAGPTTWRGQRAMRLSVSSWRTTEDDIDASAEAVIELFRQQVGSGQ